MVTISRIGVKSVEKTRDVDLTEAILTDDLLSIVQDPDVDLVVELLGGLEPARSLILSSIAHHKHVVTANKAVIARYGQEIFRAAEAAGVYVLLEGAVCGGIPVIQPLRQALAGNYLRRILGIINGTTNFILTQMSTRQMSFADALSLAQSHGYAEADPSADVEGWDAADKISILASIAFGAQVDRESIPCDGIRSVTATDIRYAQEWGYVIKLLAVAERLEHPECLDIRVHPTLIPISHPLASVNQVDNAVLVQGDPIGQVMLFGPGAGRGPTASAVVGDILSIVANLQMASPVLNPLLRAHATSPFPLQPTSELASEFYLRLLATDAPGVIGAIGTCFGECQVSLECIIQKASHEAQAEIVVLTHTVREEFLRQAVAKIEQLPMVTAVVAVFRVLPETGSQS
jgi:homoserine dehydrogenase